MRWSSMSNGRTYEKDVLNLYQQAGYRTYLPPKAKFREQDVFGLFDLLAFGHDRLEAVQVKGSRDAAGINDWFEDARVFEEILTDLRLSFIHRSEGAWRVARTTPDGWTWVYDGRDSITDDDGPLLEVLRA
jgi:hypothetical protein